MFGQPAGFGGFGQSQPQQAASPFGATPASNPFGAPAFGQQQQQAPAFGAGGGLFGQASAPAFGAASAPAFGAAAPAFGAQQPRPAFGGAFGAAPAFGASQPAFGAASAPAFGMQQQSQPAFGATPTPAFGMGASSPAFGAASAPAFGAASAPAFGAPNPFGGSTFGASSPAFGAASAPAFGMGAAPAFGAASAASPFGGGSSIFGATAASPGAFGAQPGQQQGGLMFGAAGGGAFGMQQQQAVGTRSQPYQKTVEKESSAAGGSGVANYITITAMPAYQNKSQEELRFEDYSQGVKSAAAGPPQQQQAAGGLFGGGAGAFGQQPAAGGFGAAAPFGTSAPAFGAPQQAPAFGSPASTPAFGAAASAPAFGFGQSAPGFGAAPATGFGGFGASSAAFGQTQATGSIFGSSPSFASSPSIFGGGAAAPAFGAQASSASIFSFNTAPSMFSGQSAAATQPSPFGTQQTASNPFGTTALSPFGQSSAAAGGSLFAPSTTSAFGTGAFGAAKPAFSFASASAPNTSFSGFGFSSGAASSPGLFGATTASAFAPASSPAMGGFSFASSPGLFSSPAPGGYQVPGQGQALAMAQGPPPSVGQAPYGAFPALPAVSEPKVGISARPVGKGAAGGGPGAGALRNSPLLSLRSAGAMQRVGVQIRSTGATPLALIAATPAPSLAPSATDGTPAGLTSSGGTSMGAAPSNGALMLPARANPHRLFIREPPPGTEAATSTSPALTPIRSPHPASDGNGTGAATGTPDRAANGDYSGHGHHHHHHHYAAARATGTPSTTGAGTGAHGNNGSGVGAALAGDGESVLPRLGRLASEGYSYEPSAVQLQAMHASDPSSLRGVSGFTVTRRGFGQIRWLRPVDVTGLALNRIVTIGEGEVYCYADEDKPPVGQGLNTDAEVTLCNVYKLDPTTRQPVRDGPAVLKWERQLRSMCVKMGAKFVSYKADGGVWKFEVEHFSRYGLLDIDDDEEEFEQLPAPAEAAARKLPVARFGLVSGDATEDSQGMSDEEREGWLAGPSGPSTRHDLPTYMEQEEEGADGEGGPLALALAHPSGDQGDEGHAAAGHGVVFGLSGTGFGRGGEAAVAAGPALQHSLPAQLNLDPSGLMAMHGSLFGGRAEAPAPQAAGLGAPGSRPQPSTQHVWRRGPSPLTSTSSGTRALLRKEPASPAIAPLGAAATPGPAATRTPAGAARSPGAAAAAAAAAGAASMCFADAGLCLGPSFRVGWGPGGKLVYPGNVGQCQAVHVRRVLVEGSAVDGSALAGPTPASGHSPSHTSTGATSATASPPEGQVAAVRQRLISALEVHLRYSSPDVPPLSLDGPALPGQSGALAPLPLPASGEEGGEVQMGEDAGAGQGAAESGAGVAAAAAVPRWSLLCDRRGLPRLVESYLHTPEADVLRLSQQQQGGVDAGRATTNAAATATGGTSATAAELLLLRRHEAETWKLIQALWEHIEGEDDSHAASAADAAMAGGIGEGGESSLGSLDMFAGQSTLAAFRRRRSVAAWLRRQAKVLVEAELASVTSAPEATLRLAAAGQTAAAAAVAVAAGDVRLATLLAQAGYGARGEVREEMEDQLAVWERSDVLRHVAPDRLLLYRLLAGQVDEVRDRLSLDWRRYLGLLLEYAIPATASPAAAIQRFTTCILSDRAAPRPSPLYADTRGSLGRFRPRDTHSPSARDLHYELLCLWAEQQQYAEAQGQYGTATAPAAPPSSPDTLAALLQAATYSANPLDAGLSWHVMTLLQALGVLPGAASSTASNGSVAAGAGVAEDNEDWQAAQERAGALMAVQSNLITQLQLVGGMAEWQVYVALHTPDVAAWPGLRSHLVRELLTLNCPEWLGSADKMRFLTQTLGLPQALLAEAEATWARYQGDNERHCAALLASGATRQAHELLVSAVAPMLFLSGREAQLKALLQQLASGTPPIPTAEWESGGGLYASFLSLFAGADGSGVGSVDEAAVGALLGRLQAAGDKLNAAAATATAATSASGQGPTLRQQQLRQQLAYSRMAAKLHQTVMGTAAAYGPAGAAQGQGAAARKVAAMQGMLGLHDSCLPSELRMSGIATAAAAVTASAASAQW